MTCAQSASCTLGRPAYKTKVDGPLVGTMASVSGCVAVVVTVIVVTVVVRLRFRFDEVQVAVDGS
jgi:preprotein translocase subunit SecF